MGPLDSYGPQNTRINISFIWRVCFSSLIRTRVPSRWHMAKQSGSETTVATRADHQCFLFSIPVCITVKLWYNEVGKIGNLFLYIEIFLFWNFIFYANKYSDWWIFLTRKGRHNFSYYWAIRKSKIKWEKKNFIFVYWWRKIRFHALSTISSNWWYDVKPAMLSHPLRPSRW